MNEELIDDLIKDLERKAIDHKRAIETGNDCSVDDTYHALVTAEDALRQQLADLETQASNIPDQMMDFVDEYLDKPESHIETIGDQKYKFVDSRKTTFRKMVEERNNLRKQLAEARERIKALEIALQNIIATSNNYLIGLPYRNVMESIEAAFDILYPPQEEK